MSARCSWQFDGRFRKMHCTDVITFIGIFVNMVDIAVLSIVDRWSVRDRKKRKRHTVLSFYATHPQLFMYKGMHDRTDAETCFFVFPSLSVHPLYIRAFVIYTNKRYFVFHKKEPCRATCFCFSLLSFTYSENFKFFHLSVLVFLKIKSFKVTWFLKFF